MAKNEELNRRLKGKGSEEQKVIKYFLAEGCMAGLTGMKDEEYEGMIMAKLNGLNLRERALNKIGLDEDQVSEIAPVYFHGYEYDPNKKGLDRDLAKVGGDGRLRTSRYSGTWLFFSADQVYMYSYAFDMTSGSKKERTEEYFYRDITNFSTSSETVESIKAKGCGGGFEAVSQDMDVFSLVVPGDRFTCSISGVPDADSSVTAMKNQLRAKKLEK